MNDRRAPAPIGYLPTYDVESFGHGGFVHDVYRKGAGPAVLVLTEMPGISPQVLGFADRVVDMGFTAILPDLFGEAGRDPLHGNKLATAVYAVSTMTRACISNEFSAFALGTPSAVVGYLRALASVEHRRCGGPGVGVVGMCFTGGFALAMAVDPIVLAPVLSQPSLPFARTPEHGASIDCDERSIDIVAKRCAAEQLRVIGLRFKGDPLVPRARFAYLEERLGDGFVSIELEQDDGHPGNPLPRQHSVLTTGLIDEPGEPTRDALDTVLSLFRTKLLVS